MVKDDYDNWDKQQLVDEIRALKKRKRYGLVWEDKSEQVAIDCETKLPVLEEVKSMAIVSDTNAPTNLMIEGDNYHALSVLNYTHSGKIDVIYIDPPYNTGAKDWKYNNNYVDKHDGYRHSKWINFMSKRLHLAKPLLAEKGIICVTIDHHEIFPLGILMDEIFGEHNRLGIVSVIIKEGGRNLGKFFSPTNEFYLIYARNKSEAGFNKVTLDEDVAEQFNMEDAHGKYKLIKFIRDFDPDATRETQPKRWYPIYVSSDLRDITLKKKKGYHEIFPISSTGREMIWTAKPNTFNRKMQEGDFVAVKNDNDIVIMKKVRETQVYKTHWAGKKYDAVAHGTKLLKNILGKGVFPYAKSLYAVIDFLKITSPRDGLILDFFAGSGTTGHAVSMLNQKDGGNRRYILCTNNENDIARKACHPRIKAVIEGHEKQPTITGIASNLKYYKTTFVPALPTDDNKLKIMKKAADMLCVRENTFEEVKICQSYRVYRNASRYIGIIYTESAIGNFKKYAAKIRGAFHVYIFSLGKEDYAEEFEDMPSKVQTHPIPEEILRAYRQISQKRRVK